MGSRLEKPEWNVPARVARGGVLASVTTSTVLDMVGRWSQFVVVIRAPAAWDAAHVLTVRATNRGAAPAVLVVTLSELDWQTIDGGLVEAVVSVANRPCEGFVVDLVRGAALGDPGEATLIAEARGEPDGSAAPTAERADLTMRPRALPQVSIVALGLDSVTGVLRALAVDATGALETA